MKNKNTKITTTIVLAILFGSVVFHTLGSVGSTVSERGGQVHVISQASPAPLNLNINLVADGASFPLLLIQQYISNYQAAHPNVTISYTSTGSGKGQRDFINKTVDFAASDAPLNSGQRILAPNSLHIPETIGSVTAAYNLLDANQVRIPTGSLNLDGPTIANIYLGTITNWNDSAIRALNPTLKLPNQPIAVVYRSDGSGTTFVWTSYLSQESTTWRTTSGLGPSTGGTGYPWPVGVGAAQNIGVANKVNSTNYAFGYVELAYIIKNGMTVANIKNPAGNLIFPTEPTTANAVADGASSLPSGSGDWSAVNLLNEPGAQDYPIASFSYFLVYKELNVIPSMDDVDKIQAKYLIDFLRYCITTGQSFGSNLGFVPLPPSVVSLDQSTIDSITFTDASTPINQAFDMSIGGNSWSQTSLTVASQDNVTMNLISTDGLTHQWFIDFNNNGVLDPNENWTTVSPKFSSTSIPIVFKFTPVIWSQEGIPGAASYTFRDVFNPSATGTIVVHAQQTAAPFQPNSSLSSALAPVLDSSRISTIGTALIDMRTLTVSGNITVVAVDKTSGSLVLTKSYQLTHLPLSVGGVSNNPHVRAELNIGVLPNALASDIFIELTGFSARATNFVLRNPDVAGDGSVDIVDVSIVFLQYGQSVGTPTYNPKADIDGNGRIDIIDASIIALRFGTIALR